MSQKLIVSPLVKTLVFSKVPGKVGDWVDRIAKDWSFRRIIPAHFAAPNAGRSDFLAAFAFLDELLGERFVMRSALSLLFASFLGKAVSYWPPRPHHQALAAPPPPPRGRYEDLHYFDRFLFLDGAVKKTVSGCRW